MKIKLLLSLLIVHLCSFSMLAQSEEGHFVELRKAKQYVVVKGKGNPTVVFITGLAQPYNSFETVYTEISKTNRIFAYDRAGLGRSESLNNERTVDTMAYELHELLAKEKIKGPYILVAHSMGGYIARCFAVMYPEKVQGIVFVDASYESEYKNGYEMRNESDRIKFKKEFESYLYMADAPKGINDETKYCFDYDTNGYCTNASIVKNLKISKNIPITALVSVQIDDTNPYAEKEIAAYLQYYQVKKSENPQMKIVTTSKSWHFIQNDEPQLVISTIQEMINQSK